MSTVSVLLEPETKLQQWSALNCYSLSAQNITATNIQGGIGSTNEDIKEANCTFASGGAGAVFNTAGASSVAMQWVSLLGGGKARQASFAIEYTNMSGVYNGTPGTTSAVLDVTLPFSENWYYPASVGKLIPGSFSAFFRTSGPAYYPCSCYAVRKNATQLSIYITIQGNWTTPAAPQTLSIGACFNYEVV